MVITPPNIFKMKNLKITIKQNRKKYITIQYSFKSWRLLSLDDPNKIFYKENNL